MGLLFGECFVGHVPGSGVQTGRAMLGFHAGWSENKAGERVTSPTGTQVLYEMYPPIIRNWIARQGGLGKRTIVLEGLELAAIYRYCN